MLGRSPNPATRYRAWWVADLNPVSLIVVDVEVEVVDVQDLLARAVTFVVGHPLFVLE